MIIPQIHYMSGGFIINRRRLEICCDCFRQNLFDHIHNLHACSIGWSVHVTKARHGLLMIYKKQTTLCMDIIKNI